MTNLATMASLDERLRKKIDSCREIIRQLGGVVVAFSGGVDSSFLLALAIDTLGRPNVLPAMAVSTIFPHRDYRAGRELVVELGVDLVELPTPQLTDPHFTSNPTDRCYYCKTQVLGRLKELANQRGLTAVVSGANADDMSDYRPGSRAEVQLGVRRPLLEAGMTKADVRAASKAMGLKSHDRPSLACLASRVPYGEPITEEKITRVEQAEEYLMSLGFTQCRLRDHGKIARVEVPLDELKLAMAFRQAIVDKLKGLGYTYVALDMQGFRSGSMNETLSK